MDEVTRALEAQNVRIDNIAKSLESGLEQMTQATTRANESNSIAEKMIATLDATNQRALAMTAALTKLYPALRDLISGKKGQ